MSVFKRKDLLTFIFLKYPGQEFRLIGVCSAFLWLHVQVVTRASVTGGVT